VVAWGDTAEGESGGGEVSMRGLRSLRWDIKGFGQG